MEGEERMWAVQAEQKGYKGREKEGGCGGGVGDGGRKRSFPSAEVQCCESVSELVPLELLTDPATEVKQSAQTQHVSSALRRIFFLNIQETYEFLILHLYECNALTVVLARWGWGRCRPEREITCNIHHLLLTQQCRFGWINSSFNKRQEHSVIAPHLHFNQTNNYFREQNFFLFILNFLWNFCLDFPFVCFF